MTWARRAVVLLAALMLLVSGCGSGPQKARSAAVPGPPLSLARSVVAPGGTWAVVMMGGPAGGHDSFWELLTRPGGTHAWRLATPPGVASNGGLVIAGRGGGSVVAGFRPSQRLVFSPLAATSDNGATWSPGLLDAGLANVPSALAADAGDGRLLALASGGNTELSVTGGRSWARLVTLRFLARSAAGRRCGLESISGAAFSPSGMPMLAGTCRHRRTAGVFAFASGRWRLAGPALPACPAGQPTRVIGLSVAGNRETALLAAGTGRGTVLQGAWSDGRGRWALSPSLPLGGAQAWSVSGGPGGSIGIVFTGRAGVTLAGPGSSWQWLPFLPSGTQVLAVGSGTRVDALAAAGTMFTDWAWTPGSAAWARTQTLHVPVPYGSSS
jgi:hypothetical protein